VIDMSVEVTVALFAWGTLVGLDLVSLPQVMVSRPIVVGAVAGWLTGDLATGVTLGVILELFALESVAVGAARYPDFGAATVGAVVAGSGNEGHGLIGLAVVLGLVLASIGGWTLNRLRHANATAVRRREASLRTGDPVAVGALQYGGLLRDLARSMTLSLLALLSGFALRTAPALPDWASTGLLMVVIGGGLAGAATGAIRNAGRGRRLKWLGIGALIGILLLVGGS
jgi:mannose/fructose/N-acetylgalactosamine-specific phosphotransferase system component IIC